MLTVLGQNATTIKHMSTAFRSLVFLPPAFQQLKVVITFPKMTSIFSHHV